MARRRLREAEAPTVELPDRLTVCFVEDWIGSADYRPPSHWPTTTNGRPTIEFPGALELELERTAQRRWNAARRAWAADRHHLDARTFPVSRPRWRTDPQPPLNAA